MWSRSRQPQRRRLSNKETLWPEGVLHESCGSVDSTLDVAAARAKDLKAPTWFTATRESAPRGRRGRPWVAPAGNFYGTLALPLGEMSDAPLRSFVAALAVLEALEGFGVRGLALKWPNDVLLVQEGRTGKLAGILLESLSVSGKPVGVAIGIGVNLAEAPAAQTVEPGAVPPAAVSKTDVTIAPEMYFLRLAARFAHWETILTSMGFAQVRTAWLSHAARLGEVITARTTRETIQGRFSTVDANGTLILETDTGQRRITAADVFF